eukprot:4791179-Prorocentrum_lima.AAC.1
MHQSPLRGTGESCRSSSGKHQVYEGNRGEDEDEHPCCEHKHYPRGRKKRKARAMVEQRCNNNISSIVNIAI